MGGGMTDRSIRLVVDDNKRRLWINGIEGHVTGPGSIWSGAKQTITWRHGLIGLNRVRATRVAPRRLFLSLTDGTSSVEFQCRR